MAIKKMISIFGSSALLLTAFAVPVYAAPASHKMDTAMHAKVGVTVQAAHHDPGSVTPGPHPGPHPGPQPSPNPGPCPPHGHDPNGGLFGRGLTKKCERVVGDASQWGSVNGLLRHKRAWVLSTGYASDVVGRTQYKASSWLGGAGDHQLTSLAGVRTYDAVTYRATVVPRGSTIKVRYFFASEEYPFYARSRFNDVMNVTVNGQRCTCLPNGAAVSVANLSRFRFPRLFGPNLARRTGVYTALNGISIPLTCTARVTPGVPAQLAISIADAGDGGRDSAVIMPERAIWSD